jgi:xanthine dehydrogenase YagR molybdenum-binding subunit
MPLKACAPIPEGSVVETFRPFQDDLIRYAGQPVAAVIAEMLEQATEACLRLVVNYEQRKAVADLDDPEALPAQMQPSGEPRGDAQKTFAKAAVRIEQSYSTPREYNSAIEMHSTVALWDADGGLTVWEPSQWIEGARRTLSEWFSVPFEKVRVLSPFVGGGFGSKVTLHPHSAIAVMAAKQVGRPVKLSLTRAQNFTAHGGRPATRQHISLGAGEDGRLRAVLHNNVNETSIDDDYDESGEDLARVAYASPDFSARAGVVHANIITPGWMRAPGEAVGAYALECAMDELAYQLQMDPIELRLRNLADHDPENGKPWSTRRLREAYQAGAEAFGWAERSPEPRSMRRGSELVGWGMAGGLFPVYGEVAEARIRICADGTVEVATAGVDIGTGTYTILAQTAAETLGVPLAQIRVRLGDTDLPPAPVAGSSQLANVLTSAVHATACSARDELLRLAASDPASPFQTLGPNDFVIADGLIGATGHDSGALTIAAFLQTIGRDQIEVTANGSPHGKVNPEEWRSAIGTLRLHRSAAAGLPFSVHSWCAQFVEVGVDEDFGTVRVRRMIGAFDCGRIYNPKLAESQWRGGMIMGLGQALLEAVVVDRRDARIINDNLAEYLLPVNADVPDIQVISVGEPDFNASPLGGKTVGEIGIVGTAAAIANAVFHATGKRVRDLPITMEKLL